MTRNGWLAALAGVTLIRLLAAALVPLAPDEAYYWLWSQHLQPGYYDDAPLIAVWIRAGTALLGNGPLGIRLLSPLGAACGTLLIWRAGEDLFPDRNAGLIAAIMLNATLVLNAGAVITTPDTPLLLFWTATIAAAARWHASRDDRWFLAAGAMAGLAFESKYTGVLILAAVGLWLLVTAQGRAALRRPLPWCGLALAIALFMPVVWWNAVHHWVSFAKQGGRTTHLAPEDAFANLAALVGGQIGLVTPGIFVLATIGVIAALRTRTAAASLVWLSVVVPGAVFAEHVVSGAVQPNWPAIMIPGAALAAAGVATRITRRYLVPAAALGAAMSALVYVQAIAAPLPLPVRRDPTALQLAGWRHLAAVVGEEARSQHLAIVAASDYGLVAELAHDAPPSLTIAGTGPRWQYFGRPGLRTPTRLLLIAPSYMPRPDAPNFTEVVRLASVRRLRHGAVIETYSVYEAMFMPTEPSAVMRPSR